MPLDETGSRKSLERLLPLFWKAVALGGKDYFDQYAHVMAKHRTTTKRSIIRDHIVDRLRELIGEDVEVEIDDENQTTYFRINGQFRMLVKKADEDGAVQLAKTQRAFDFQSNERQLPLDPNVIPEVTNLYLSYVPNLDSPQLPPVYLICPKDGGYHWRMEIETPEGATIEDIGTHQPPPPADDDLVRIPPEKLPRSE